MGDTDSRLEDALKEAVVLYVEDEEEIRNLVSRYLSRFVPNLLVAGSGEEALRISGGKDIDILVTDISMKTMDGAELAIKIKERNPSCYIIFSTAYSNTDRLMQAVDISVDKFMVKPIDLKELADAIGLFAERVFMVKHLEDGGDPRCCEVISGDVYKALNEALSHIDEGMAGLSGERLSENLIKCVRGFEAARSCIERVLKEHF